MLQKRVHSDLDVKDSNVVASYDKDIWKVAALDRTFGSKTHAVGFLENFGADIGAFASTWSFHENDMIVIGSNENDMADACNKLCKVSRWIDCCKKWKNISIFAISIRRNNLNGSN